VHEQKTELLTEAESNMIKRILRSSRRDIERVEISTNTDPPTVAIKMFALPVEKLDYETAAAMKDEDWKTFFIDHPPLI
jgi:hypothetical protein